MAINKIPVDREKFKLFKYTITAIMVPENASSEEDTLDISDDIYEFILLRDFDSYIYPCVYLNISLNEEKVKFIQTKFSESRIYITIKKYFLDGEEAKDSFEDVMSEAEFLILGLDRSPFARASRDDESEEIAKQDTNIVFPLILLPVKAMSFNKSINNGIFHSTRIIDILAYFIGKNKPAKYKTWVAPLDNSREYESILVPPMPFNHIVQCLDNCYGMYKSRLITFFDIEESFILPITKIFKTDNKNIKEALIEVILPGNDPADGFEGSYSDEEEGIYRIRTRTTPVVNLGSPATREVIGEHVKIVGKNQIDNLTNDCGQISFLGRTLDSKPKERVHWRIYDNELIGDKLSAQMKESETSMIITFDSVDISMFKPNLEYTIRTNYSDGSEIDGIWRLASYEERFTKKGKDDFAGSFVKATFKPSLDEEKSSLRSP